MRWWILFAGGGLGAVLRFGLSLWIDERTRPPFPWGTLAVNVTGCFLIGLIATAADLRPWLSPGMRLFLIAGVLGGFTTFSTFGLETWRLVEDRELGAALLNAAGSVGLGMLAVVLGVLAGRAIAS